MNMPQGKFLKYVLLAIAGSIIIVSICISRHATPVPGEYHYSSFLRYSLNPATIIFFIVGLVIGYYWQLNPWLTGCSLYFIFPITAIVEALVYEGTHNLIPFELAIYYAYSRPAIMGVFIGKYVARLINQQKETTDDEMVD